MFDPSKIISTAINDFFASIYDSIAKTFGNAIANIMSSSLDIFQLPFVQHVMDYAQTLAFTIIIAKTMYEAYQTYILYQLGDPDADVLGLLIRTVQAVATVACLPWVVNLVYTFGTKVAHDVANIGTGGSQVADWNNILFSLENGSGEIAIILYCIMVLICFLVVAIQASIRGAEFAILAVIGPLMALNITVSNRSMWNAWLKQIITIALTQALQIFMIQGSFYFLAKVADGWTAMLILVGWLWVTLKTPKFVQQFLHSTGFTGSVSGATKQAGYMAMMKLVK